MGIFGWMKSGTIQTLEWLTILINSMFRCEENLELIFVFYNFKIRLFIQVLSCQCVNWSEHPVQYISKWNSVFDFEVDFQVLSVSVYEGYFSVVVTRFV